MDTFGGADVGGGTCLAGFARLFAVVADVAHVRFGKVKLALTPSGR